MCSLKQTMDPTRDVPTHVTRHAEHEVVTVDHLHPWLSSRLIPETLHLIITHSNEILREVIRKRVQLWQAVFPNSTDPLLSDNAVVMQTEVDDRILHVDGQQPLRDMYA